MSDAVVWITDYAAGLAAMSRDRRLMVVHFTSPDRPAGQAMAAETFVSAEVIRIANAHFVDVRLDAGEHPELFEKLVGDRGALATCIVDKAEDVVSLLPGFADARRYVAFLQAAQDGYGKLAVRRDAARKRSRDTGLIVRLGETYDDLDSPRRAEACFRTALTLAEAHSPSAPLEALFSAHERLTRILMTRGKAVDARNELEEARKLQPQTSVQADRFLLTEGLLLSLERKLREATARLGELVQRDPQAGQHPEALFTLGSLQHELRHDRAALATLEELQRNYPDSRFSDPGRRLIEHIRNPGPVHEH